MARVVFFTIHNTTSWWTYLGSQINFADAVVLSDLRDDGGVSLVDDFYRFMRGGDPVEVAVDRHGVDGCADIVRRCRVLRSLDRSKAMRMIGAMTQAIERTLDSLDPELIVGFTMDRYVMDVLDRVARRRGVDFLEMTTSIIPNEVLFMRRGRPIQLWEPDDAHVAAAVDILCADDFAPSYVRDAKKFTPTRFLKIYGYYALRGAYFNALRHVKRDPLNLHYIDALKRLKHKVGIRDIAVLGMPDSNWQDRLAAAPKERRVFLGLQLFPEASMDYWLRDIDMLRHDDAVVRYCEVFGESGYVVFVKDHPLQFGFRQSALMRRLSKLPFVTLVPYDVSANLLLGQCEVSVTFTGTIGFQAALAGLCSIVTEPYYATDENYIHIRDFASIDSAAEQVGGWRRPSDFVRARRSMVRHLAGASVPGDYFTWRNFDPEIPNMRHSVESLVATFNTYLPRFMRSSVRSPPDCSIAIR